MCWPLVGRHIFGWGSTTTTEESLPEGAVCDCGGYKIWRGQAVPMGRIEYDEP